MTITALRKIKSQPDVRTHFNDGGLTVIQSGITQLWCCLEEGPDNNHSIIRVDDAEGNILVRASVAPLGIPKALGAVPFISGYSRTLCFQVWHASPRPRHRARTLVDTGLMLEPPFFRQQNAWTNFLAEEDENDARSWVNRRA